MANTKRVWLFEEANATMRDELGGKGANLAEMSNIGLPVPPGFTITTDTCIAYNKGDGQFPAGLLDEIKTALAAVETKTGKKLGDATNPLLVSVRSGAKFSMPGMMDTVLNLGLNDETAEALIKLTGNARFVYDSYRRFLMMLSDVAYSTPDNKLAKHDFEHIFYDLKKELGVTEDLDVSADHLKALCDTYKTYIKEQSGKDFPQDPFVQLEDAVEAVFKSWFNDRAKLYRQREKISDDLGTAVNIQSMVFGNQGEDCGTGVAFTRDASNGANEIFGEYLMNAQGEDVVAGVRTPMPISGLKTQNPEIYQEFDDICQRLEQHYKDMQDIEFTIEHNKLYILQCRSGKRTGPAAVKIAVDLVNEGLITKEVALARINPELLDQCLHPVIKPGFKYNVLAKGLPAGPGAATGIAVFDAQRAADLGKGGEGKKVILVRADTSPDDLKGMLAAEGVLTERGGMTSHAALVARGFGIPTVAGCSDITVTDRQFVAKGGQVIKEGDYISLNGAVGEVIEGQVEVVDPELTGEFGILLQWADETRRLGIRTNADTPEDVALAIKLGAEGVGLCRTEHMFFAEERRPVVQAMILAATEEERNEKLAELLPFQREDFRGIFEALGSRPATIRLIDPPLHEFLPSLQTLIEEVATLKATGSDAAELEAKEKLMAQVESMHEINPMMGLRGCRLSIVFPGIVEMQTRAILEGAIAAKKNGADPHPEIMIPLVGHVNELKSVRSNLERVAKLVVEESGETIDYMFGTMIEIPRAALTSDQIAEEAEFFSFGTNDLTQMTFGFSRDDSDKFLKPYIEQKILPGDPFESIDQTGVGQLMKISVELAKKVRPNIKLGICGEHGGEPSSIAFCHEIGLNYVSCSPYRVPIARLAAAQANLKDGGSNRDR
ncbi:MAG: pyruvate, phosphate dikinase [Capsulimonas sp.]|uniref:pyruvate, phosphate dikinase n=1 Tax=Capsulimonas sp. TaxID=2494211 RepID=UPI0032643BF3